MVKKIDSVLEYFNGDELAAASWTSKYALDGEVTPEDTLKRVAKEFARIEQRNKGYYPEKRFSVNLCDYSDYYKERKELNEGRIYELFKGFKYIVPGGSVLYGCGNPMPISLSNCFVLGAPDDSYSSIMNIRNQLVQIEKRRGGVGIDLSKLRPRGAAVNNSAGTSTGAASFMQGFSDLNNEVAQQGRRGALMLTLSISHPDIEEFIEKKQDLTKVTGANISVKVTDEFMTAVEDDSDYYLRWPCNITDLSEIKKYGDRLEYNQIAYFEDSSHNKIYFKKIKAKNLWNKLIHCAWNTAEPGIIFEDTMHNNAPDGVYDKFKMISTNPCQPAWATVLTKDGIRTFSEVNVGDTIWSSEGWTKIINKQSSGIKRVKEYRTTAGSFYGTENHKLVSFGNKIEAKDARSIDILQGPINISNLYPEYIMDGLVIGDGSTHKCSNNLVYLNIGQNDKDYFESPINKLIIKHRPALKEYAYEVETSITHDELPHTYIRVIPDRFFKGNYDIVCSFLCGLYSANGSVVGNRVTLKTSSSRLRDQVIIMLSSVGIRSYYTVNKPHKVSFSNGDYECKESYDINISSDRDIFYKNIGFIQKYKMSKLEKSLQTQLNKEVKNHKIVEVTTISEEEVFNITVDNDSHTYWTGGLNVSNCGEIGMGAMDSCRLMHINLTSFIDNPFTENAILNHEKLYEVAYESIRLADDLVDLELEAVDKIIDLVKDSKDDVEYKLWSEIRDIGRRGRRCGVGIMGLADMFAMMGIRYGSDESLKFADNVMSIIFKAQLNSTIDLALERGPFLSYDGEIEENARKTNEWYKMVCDFFPEENERMKQVGRRNISFSTIAPTGTVSMMAQCSSGIEPVFMSFYERKKKCTNDNDRVDYVDKVGEKFTIFLVVHPYLKKWATIKYGDVVNDWKLEDWTKAYTESPYYESIASDIPYDKRVELQSVCQTYITHSISSTINLPKDTNEEVISNIYKKAWLLKNKGQTVYRDQCREGVLTSVGDTNKANTILDKDAPKRPKSLDADFYSVKVKAEQFIILVGLLEGKPYEVFAFKPSIAFNIPNHKGKIIKVKKMHYTFVSDKIQIDNLQLANDNIEERAATLYTSMLLRHGVPIKHIIKIAKKVNENIISFSSAMCRTLSKYLDKEDTSETCPNCGGRLVREGGCIHCLDCEYSKCL